jgi:hypothetical protein
METNRPLSGTVLARLWDAYDDELREAGVLMVNVGAWRQAVSRGEAPCSIAEAIAALNADISVARGHDETHDAQILQEWVNRLYHE